MTADDDKHWATALHIAARHERLSFEALVARVDDELLQRTDAPAWLIHASLARNRNALLDALASVTGGEGDADASVARAEALVVAAAVLDVSMSPILGARELARLLRRAGVPEGDPELLTFVAIASETDALPVGPLRQLWAPEALARKEAELAAAESRAMVAGTNAFRAVLDKWKGE